MKPVPATLQQALRASGAMLDWHVLLRRSSDGREWPVVYAVAPVQLSADQRQQRLGAIDWPGGAAPHMVWLARLPLDEHGAVDDAQLRALPVLDEATLAAAEQAALALPGLRRGVALGRLGLAPAGALHRAQLESGWQRAAFKPGTGGGGTQPEPTPVPPNAPPALSQGAALPRDEQAPRLLTDLLLRATQAPAPAGLLMVQPDGHETACSYSQLLAQAQCVLAGLRQAGLKPGDKLLFQLQQHEDFLSAFWACQLGGMVPVPVGVPPAFADANAPLRRLAQVLEMFEQPVLVGDKALLSNLQSAQSVLPLPAWRGLDIAQLRLQPAALQAHPAHGDDIALMMLTSGSTGRPKGVPLSHRRLLAQLRGMAQALGYERHLVALSWMPLDHVAGLLMAHLQETHQAARQVLVQSEDILRSPLLWLDLIERHRVMASFAPNFAYGLVNGLAAQIAQRRWDLSSLRWLTNGGEAIVAATARRFLALLAPHGLRGDVMVPAWGMSELCSGVTFDAGFRLDSTRDDDPQVIVGPPMAGVSLRVVDEQGRLLRQGEVGQLEVSGDTVFGGYYGTQFKREDSFTADGWFRTGDLARLDQGRLSITGRDKAVIIINGANFAGAAIEAAVEELPGVERSYTAAAAVADPQQAGQEGLALYFVPSQDDDAHLAVLLRAIRQKLVRSFGISPAVLVALRRTDIAKTSIGKIQRAALQKALLAGDFESALRRVDILSANQHTLPAWFFERGWQCAPPLALEAAAQDRGEGLLIWSPADDADALALLQQLPQALWVHPGVAVQQVGPRQHALGPDLRAGMLHWRAQWALAGQAIHRLIWLGAAAPLATSGQPSQRTADRAMQLIDVLAPWAQAAAPLNLAIVQRQASAVHTGERSRPECAALAVLTQTLVQEHANWRALHIDLDAAAPAELAARILAEMATPVEGGEVAWRGRRRWLPVLRPVSVNPQPAQTALLRRGACHVISGGLGGIGIELALWLCRERAAQVLLLARQAPNAQQRSRLAEGGSAIRVGLADITDAAALRQVLPALLGDAQPALLWHLAGGYHEAALMDESAASLQALLAPKLDGLQALLSVLGADVPRILFSSAASLFGGAWVGGYAAANRALDACAGVGPTWLLHWSLWHDTGLAQRFGNQAPLQAMGVLDMAPEQALGSLPFALARPGGAALAIGLSADTPFMARRVAGVPMQAQIQVFCEVAPGFEAPPLLSIADAFGQPCAVLLRALPHLPLDEQGQPDRAALEHQARSGRDQRLAASATEVRLVSLWRRLLRVQSLGVDDSFFDLGGQSLLAGQLSTAISAEFGLPWTLRDVFEAASVAQQARRIDERLARPALLGPDTEEPALLVSRSTPDAPAAISLLGAAQQRLWFLQHLHRHSCAFNIPASIDFAQAPDPLRLQHTLQQLVDRHDSLRMRFVLHDGQPRPEVLAHLQLALPVHQLGMGDDLADWAQREARTSFDLHSGPLIRAQLLLFAQGGARLLLTLHHIIADGWSMKVVFQDWLALWRGCSLPQLTLRYADFAAAQQAWAGSADEAAHLAYWAQALGGQLQGLSLPTDRPRASVQSHAGAIWRQRLPRGLARQLRALAAQQGVTQFTALLAAFKVLLARHARQTEIVIGSVFVNRDRAEFEALVGFFVSLLPLRTDLGGDPRFVDVLRRVHSTVMGAQAHHRLPFETLVQALRAPRDSSRSPLFQIAFDLRDRDITRCDEPGLAFNVMAPDLGATPYDLHLTLEESHDSDAQLDMLWQYNTQLFERDHVARLADQYQQLLHSVVQQPQQRINRLGLLSAQGAARLLPWSRGGGPATCMDLSLQALVRASVRRSPQALALVDARQQLSYAELDHRSDQAAVRLRARGAARGSVIGLCAQRSVELVVGLLGILKTSAAYLPLDPHYPPQRLAFMLADSGATLVLTDHASRECLPSAAGLNQLALEPLCADAQAPVEVDQTRPDDLAYVIYTSGSTGRPKGVMVEHAGVCNLAMAFSAGLDIRPGKRVIQFAAFGFDASVEEIFTTLARGATLYLPAAEQTLAGAPLADYLRAQRITTATLPPSLLRVLQADALPDLDTVCSAGEACDVEIVRRWAVGRRLVNGYGPTETTVCATLGLCDAALEQAPSIGKPMAGMAVYVLDDDLQRLPVGLVGELWIGGAGVARGYLGREDLTRQRFLPDPFAAPQTGPGAASAARMYRSGDLARWRPDGSLDYLGRADKQVKLRGYRIELGEIETALRSHRQVADALADLVHDAAGEPRLVAWVVGREAAVPTTQADAVGLLPRAMGIENPLSPELLRQHLQLSVPPWMVPADWLLMPAFPVTPNGKVDRQALPPPGPSASGVAESQPTLAHSAHQALVQQTWQEVLGLPQVGLQQNFFDLGGHSLKMARVHHLLQERLGLAAPSLLDLFRFPTVASLAAQLDQVAQAAQQDPAVAAPPRPPPEPQPGLLLGRDRLRQMAARRPAKPAPASDKP